MASDAGASSARAGDAAPQDFGADLKRDLALKRHRADIIFTGGRLAGKQAKETKHCHGRIKKGKTLDADIAAPFKELSKETWEAANNNSSYDKAQLQTFWPEQRFAGLYATAPRVAIELLFLELWILNTTEVADIEHIRKDNDQYVRVGMLDCLPDIKTPNGVWLALPSLVTLMHTTDIDMFLAYSRRPLMFILSFLYDLYHSCDNVSLDITDCLAIMVYRYDVPAEHILSLVQLASEEVDGVPDIMSLFPSLKDAFDELYDTIDYGTRMSS